MRHIGIIGCGKQAPKHIKALKKIGGIKITVADIASEAARELASSEGLGLAEDPDALMADPSVDLVSICTPTPFHFGYSTKALKSGKHVFSEKPLTVSVEEAEELARTCIDERRVGMVAFLYKYHPVFTRAKEAIDGGAIGAPRALFMRLGGKGSHRQWKHDTGTGGGAVNEMLVHMLDLMLWYLGDVGSVDTVDLDHILKNRVVEGSAVDTSAEDFAVVTGRSTEGAKFMVESDMISQSYTNSIEIIGEEGYMNLSIQDTFESFVFCNGDKAGFKAGRNVLEGAKVDLFYLLFRDLLKNIEEGRTPSRNSFGESLGLARLLADIREKAQRHNLAGN